MLDAVQRAATAPSPSHVLGFDPLSESMRPRAGAQSFLRLRRPVFSSHYLSRHLVFVFGALVVKVPERHGAAHREPLHLLGAPVSLPSKPQLRGSAQGVEAV